MLQWAVPGSSGQHFGIRAEVAEADWPIITDLTAEVVEILEKRKKKKVILLWSIYHQVFLFNLKSEEK